jgi:hypothetical protein
MKQELPIAIGLLAIGCLLWIVNGWGGSSPSTVRLSNLSGLDDEAFENATQTQTANSYVAQASFQQDLGSDAVEEASSAAKRPVAKPANPLIAKQEKLDGQPIAETSPADFDFPETIPKETENVTGADATSRIDAATNYGAHTAISFLHAAGDPRSVELINDAAMQTANARPLGTKLNLTGHFFGQLVTAQGKYFQMGQGSHRSRMELVFGSNAASPTSFQLCDGRFVYRLQTLGDKQNFEFIDLRRVKDSPEDRTAAFSPSGWIASGGLASLLEQLNRAFDFGAPKQSVNASGSKKFVLRGCWNERSLRHTLGPMTKDIFDVDAKVRSRNRIRWQNIPVQLPHAVEIVFEEDLLTGVFPTAVNFIQFERQENQSSLVTKPLLEIAFEHPTPIDQLSDDMFVIKSADIESTDTTDEYLAQVGAILADRQAEKEKQKSTLLK